MAILPPKRGGQRRPSMRGNLLQDVVRGTERSRAWPEKRGSRQTPGQREQVDWFRQANWAFKLQDPKTIAMFIHAAQGTSLYPRDVFSIMAAGGLFAVNLPGGKAAYPMASVLAVSESLDVLSQQQGFILIRGVDRWEGRPYAVDHSPWWFQPPSADDWSYMNGTGWDLTVNFDPVTGASVTGGAPVSGHRLALAMRTIPGKSDPWRLSFHHTAYVDTTNGSGLGLYLRDSISGRIASITQRSNGPIATDRWTGLVGWNSSPQYLFPVPPQPAFHYQVEYDGTDLIWRYSPDAVSWSVISQGLATAWLTNLPDQIGFGFDYNRTAGPRNVMNIDRWLFERDF